MATGPCVAYVRPEVRYARCFEPTYRVWLKDWLRDFAMLDEEEYTKMLARYDADLAAVKG